jgi:hypothetical protein
MTWNQQYARGPPAKDDMAADADSNRAYWWRGDRTGMGHARILY